MTQGKIFKRSLTGLNSECSFSYNNTVFFEPLTSANNNKYNNNCRVRNVPQRLCKVVERFRNRRTNQDHPSYSIVKIGENTEKNPGDVRRLAVFQTPAEDHQLTIFTNPSARAGYDTRSIFKRSLTGFNSEFSFS